MTTVDLTTSGDAVVRDLPHDQYLAHPALSASGAKTLIKPGGPARYAHEREHGGRTSTTFDLGHAAHAAVLGVGPTIVVVDADSWRTAAAKRERDLAYAAGRVPLLIGDAARVADMADALRRHPVASRLLHPTAGDPEVSLFWHDGEHDVDRRCRVDYLRRADDDGRLILVDYKSTTSAEPDAVARSIVNYGYHQSAAWYRDVIVGLGLARTVPTVLVFQETTAPFLVHCVQLDDELIAMGGDRNERALAIYAECTASGVWPGYNDGGVTVVGPPTWARYQHAEQFEPGGDE
jgi:hypothetical protein